MSILLRWCLTRSDIGIREVGILDAAKRIENIYDISGISYCLMMIKLAMEYNIITVLCYTLHEGLKNTVKEAIFGLLHSSASKVSATEILVVCSNGHAGKLANDYEGMHGGHGYGLRNTEAEKSVGDQRMHLTTNLLKATEEICGISEYGK